MLKSDNTANNKVIQAIGGVNAFKSELRQLGDCVSEPQRLEPDLNNYDPKKIAIRQHRVLQLRHLITF